MIEDWIPNSGPIGTARYSLGPIPAEMNPEDVHRAMVKKLMTPRRVAGLKICDPAKIGANMMLDSFVNFRGYWTPQQHEEFARLSSDPEFVQRYERSVREGRALTFSKAEIFILKFWRKLEWEFQKEGLFTAPGLREWSPAAAGQFMLILHLLNGYGDPGAAFDKTRKRLGLETIKTKRVVGCIDLGRGKIKLLEPGDKFHW